MSLPLPPSYPETRRKIVSAAPKRSTRCRPAAFLVSTNTATQQGFHSEPFLTSIQDARSVSINPPIAPASPTSSSEGAGSQLNPRFGPSRCSKRDTAGVAMCRLFGPRCEKTFHFAVSLPCLQTRGSQNPESHRSGTGRYKRKQLGRSPAAAIDRSIKGRFKGNKVSLPV